MEKNATSTMPLYDQIVHSVVGELRQQGVESIKASCEGFTTPGKIQWDEKDEGIMPHIVAEHQGAVHIFEIETRDEVDPDSVGDRWRLLSVYAKRCNGDFYLLIPEKKEDDFQRVFDEISVQPKILKLRGIA